MNLLSRIFAWLLAAAVTYATLGPPSHRPHSDLGQIGEHTFAFLLVGVAFAVAYPRQRLPAAAVTVVMVGILEILQLFVPGRHARLEDFLVDASGTLIGYAIVAGIDVAIEHMRVRNTG